MELAEHQSLGGGNFRGNRGLHAPKPDLTGSGWEAHLDNPGLAETEEGEDIKKRGMGAHLLVILVADGHIVDRIEILAKGVDHHQESLDPGQEHPIKDLEMAGSSGQNGAQIPGGQLPYPVQPLTADIELSRCRR